MDLKKIILLAGLALLPTHINAAEMGKAYFNAEYSHLKVDFFDAVDANPGALFFRVGKQTSPNFAVEAYLGLGLGEDELYSDSFTDFSGNTYTESLDVEMTRTFGVQAKLMADLSPDAEFFAAIGFNNVELELSESYCINSSCASASEKDNDTDIGYSFGINIGKFTASYNVFYDDETDGLAIEVTGLNFGYHTAF